MRKVITGVVAVLFSMALFGAAFAAPGNSGNGGNNGGGSSHGGGNSGNNGNGGGNGQGGGNGGNGGGNNGGGGGNSGGGNTGGGGESGGGTTGGGSGASVSAPSGDGGSGGASGGSFGGFTQNNGEGTILTRIRSTFEALRYCTSAAIPGRGLVDYKLKADGSFTYWGYEFATPDFVQCMKDLVFRLDTAGRNELTDFGGHYGLPGHEAPQAN